MNASTILQIRLKDRFAPVLRERFDFYMDFSNHSPTLIAVS